MNDAVADDPNPYAAPQAELQQPAAVGGKMLFYAMSPLKLAILSALTFGIYDLWFWWRQWTVRRNGGQDVSVFWRTFFAPWFAFDFRSSLTLSLNERALAVPPLLAAAPTVYLVSCVLANVLGRAAEGNLAVTLLALALSVLRGYTLSVVQEGINRVLTVDRYNGPINRGLSLGACVGGGLGVVIWLLSLSAGFLPSP